MGQLWTIIFVTIFAFAFAVAAWQDHEDKKRLERRRAAHEKVERAEE